MTYQIIIPAKAYNEMMGKMEDTSLPHWQQYYAALEKHNERYASIKPERKDFPSEDAYRTAYNKWSLDESMNEPNKPGYYRANND